MLNTMKPLCAGLLVLVISAFVSSAPAVKPDEETLSRGMVVFQTCANCHTLGEGEPHSVGPNLYGLYGRKIASAEGFVYSPELSAQTGTWDDDALNRYIARPKLFLPGNQMSFRGITSPHARADLIAWLKSNPGQYQGSKPKLLVLIDEADISVGQELSSTCMACHAAGPGMPHRIGPNLWNVVGRPAASAPGFDYSERLRRRDTIWTPETLNAFLFENKEFDQGSHMAFRRLAKIEDRAAIIKWLKSLKGKSQPMATAK